MASDLVRFSVSVPEGLLGEFDAYAARRGHSSNRSEAIRDLIRDQLVADELATTPEAEVVGSITMVYSHHVPGLSERLDEVQHSHIAEIVSTMHVHLDHDNCLETLAVRGSSARVHDLADRLLGIKGVRHGKLVCVATQATMCLGDEHAPGEEQAHGEEHSHAHDGGHGHVHDGGHSHVHPHDHQHPHAH